MLDFRYILLLFISLATFSCQEEEDSNDLPKYVHVPPELPEEVISQLKDGDIAIRKGNGPLSYHLMNNTREDYSHCGIIVHENGVPKIIHTLGGSASDEGIDGVQMQELSDFVWNAADSMLYICRPIFVDSAGSKVAKQAYHYLEDQTPFDHRFSVFSTDELYCTELLFYIFRDIGGKKIFDIEKKHKSYMLMFSTFFNHKNFEPVFHLKGEDYTLSSNPEYSKKPVEDSIQE